MKKLLILNFIFLACFNCEALASERYICMEAKRNLEVEGYSATLVPNGLSLMITSKSIHPKKVKISIQNKGRNQFKARMVWPSKNSVGEFGSIVRKLRRFELDFPVVPLYKETNTQLEYFGGNLIYRGQSVLMLCDAETINLFTEYEECDTNCSQ